MRPQLSTSGEGRVYLFSYLKISSPGSYRISAHFRNLSGTAKPFICAYDTSAGAKLLLRKFFPTPPSDKYVKYSFEINLKEVPRENLAIIFGVDKSKGTVLLDDVEMEKISPSAFPEKDAVVIPLKGTSFCSKIESKKETIDLNPLKSLSGKRSYDGVLFKIRKNGVAVGGPKWASLKKAVNLAVPPGKYSELYGLACAMYAEKKEGFKLGELVFEYSDGSSKNAFLVNRHNLQDWYHSKYAKKSIDPAVNVTLDDLTTL